MAICYQYESAYFPAPYADNQLLSVGGGGGGGLVKDTVRKVRAQIF